MKRIGFIATVITISVFMFSGCLQYRNILNTDQATNLQNSLDRIITTALVRKQGEKEWEKVEQKGTSFPIGNGYQLSLTHTTLIERNYSIRLPFGIIYGNREIKDEKFFIKGKEIKLVGRVGDISLFKKDWVADYPYKLGDNPIVGTELIVIGDSQLNGNNIKTGIVSMINVGRYVKEDEEYKFCFVHTVPTNGGDSGSPVLAVSSKGEYEVVGVINAKIPTFQGYNFALKISYIKDAVSRIKKQKKSNN